jgi:hypothetical protein
VFLASVARPLAAELSAVELTASSSASCLPVGCVAKKCAWPGPEVTGSASRTRPMGLPTGVGPAAPADQAPRVPATAAAMATAVPVSARWILTDVPELGVRKGDKMSLLSGAHQRARLPPCACLYPQ